MSMVQATVSVGIQDSFRVRQVAGMFDLPVAETVERSFEVEVPSLDEPWRIGAIVGPSGSGKTTIARAVFGDRFDSKAPWSPSSALVDGLGDLPFERIVALLAAVGLGAPPIWRQPYHVLSGGERLRADLARALANVSKPDDLVVFDEFASLVDRRAGKVAAAALARSIRKGRVPGRFVAISLDPEIRAWLGADWVVDMSNATCQRRRLRRPKIELEISRCRADAWARFARHHYLSGSLNPAATAYLARWRGQPVGFCAVLPLIGRKGRRRVTRLVVAPDFQGIGVGAGLLEAVAEIHRQLDQRMNLTTSHPFLIAHCKHSLRWRTVQVLPRGHHRPRAFLPGYRTSAGRSVVSFEYRGPTDVTWRGLQPTGQSAGPVVSFDSVGPTDATPPAAGASLAKTPGLARRRG